MGSHRGHTGGAYRTLRAWVIRTFDDCLRCGLPVDKTLSGRHVWGPSLDLVLPYKHGGQLTQSNARLSHLGCNAAYRDGRAVTHRVRQAKRYAPSRDW